MSDASNPPSATTCGYCGVGCRAGGARRATARSLSISPARRAGQRGHTCLKGRFAPPVRALARIGCTHAADPRSDGSCAWPAGTRRSTGRRPRSRAIKDEHGPDAIAGAGLLACDQRGLLRDGSG